MISVFNFYSTSRAVNKKHRLTLFFSSWYRKAYHSLNTTTIQVKPM